MPVKLSVVVLLESEDADLPATLRSVERQRGDGHVEMDAEVVVVLRDTDKAERALRPPAPGAAEPRIRWVRADGLSRGAAWNVGLQAVSGQKVVRLEAGDRLHPDYARRVGARLDREAALAFVAPWATRASHDGHALVEPVTSCDLATVLTRFHAVSHAATFRRAAWRAVGGFDEALPALVDYEFWLRLLAAGHQGAVLAEILVHLPGGAAARGGARWTTRHDRALEVIFDRYEALFAADPAVLLSAQERLIRSQVKRHDRLYAARAGHLAEVEGLEGQIVDLERRLAPAAATFDWGDLRQTAPLSRNWGYERGTPIDRYYIESFLERHAADIRGAVLEVQEADYTRRFGGERVQRSDVVDVDPSNSRATVVADLRRAAGIPSETYDCLILTQTLHVIDDMGAVLAESRRILRSGGVLLATLPCLSRVCLEYGPDGDFWRVTEAGARRLFSEVFGPEHLEIRAVGNIATSIAFLQGLACHELTPEEFEASDPYFPLLVTVRAVKPVTEALTSPIPAMTDFGAVTRIGRWATTRAGLILRYHRVAHVYPDTHGLAVSPEQFWEHMEFLRRHCDPMPLTDLAAATRTGRLPRRAVAVTLDDGYLDNLTIASPILCATGIPATFFVAAELRATHQEFWWDTLERALLCWQAVPGVLEITVSGERRRLATATLTERRAAHTLLHGALVAAHKEERELILTAIAKWSGVDANARAEYRRMTGPEVRELAERPGHTVGSHGCDHLALPLQVLETRHQEIRDSKARLEKLLGRMIATFSYPYGAFDADLMTVVQDAGFECAVTCEKGLIGPGANIMELPRLEVSAMDRTRFATVVATTFAANR